MLLQPFGQNYNTLPMVKKLWSSQLWGQFMQLCIEVYFSDFYMQLHKLPS